MVFRFWKWNSVVKSIKSEVGVKIVEKFNVIAGSGTEFLSVIGLCRISTAPSSDFSSEIG
jgi:hypothetical protein